MSYCLFLDDVREPPYPVFGPWTVARTMAEAQEIVLARGCPYYMSLDHDLGSVDGVVQPTGYDFAKWFIEQDMDGKISIPKDDEDFIYNSHSANPVGMMNIMKLLESYLAKR